MSNLTECGDCGHKVSINATACPNCGNTKVNFIEMLRAKLLAEGFKGPFCPSCKGPGIKLDASSRGRAFGMGNMIASLTKTHKCHLCGYLF